MYDKQKKQMLHLLLESASKKFFKDLVKIKNLIIFAIQKLRSVRLGVRTPGFHPGNRGSIPLRTTKNRAFIKIKIFLVRSSRG